MNPQSQEPSPSLSLPAPEVAPQQAAVPAERVDGGMEKGVVQVPEHSVTVGGQSVTQASHQPSIAPPAVSDPSAPMVQLPQTADDSDLIEKEWVIKAKHIVAQTAHDPYLQNKEMSKVKADYLKKRYNKDLKLAED